MSLPNATSEFVSRSQFSEPEEEDQSTEKDDASNKTGANAQQSQLIADIAARENEMVSRSRNLMMLVLFIGAIGMAMAAYYMSIGTYEDIFVQSFSGDASLIMSAIESRLQNNAKVMGMLSKILSNSGNEVNSTWPNRSFPDFESLATDTLTILNAEQILYAPLVRDEDRLGWEQYSNQLGGTDIHSTGSSPWTVDISNKTSSKIPAFIHRQRLDGPIVREFPLAMYSPVWQIVPAQNDITLFNYNLLNVETIGRLVNATVALGTGAFSELIDSQSLFGSSAVPDSDPRSILVEPIFKEANNPESSVVGHLIAFIPWTVFFEGIISESPSVAVDAVIEQTCGEEFTYSIGSQGVLFEAYDDEHERSFDEWGKSIKLSSFEGNSATTFGVPEDCESILYLFPSTEYEQGFHSENARNLMIATLVVFAVVIAIFYVYDSLVQRRQEKVHTVATKSNAIVSSLFPAQIRDKLIADDKDQKRGRRSGDSASFDFGFGSSSDAEVWTNEMQKSTLGMSEESSPPIADLFPSATVAFMDISGFTAWSSQREPSQVFILLETIYRAFDRIAKRRRVFKVETIGDCYVAVCGLPEPNKDHAIVMARFARECLEKMNQLARKLEISLGPDTAELAIRAGLHSGPVTAGVLRGDRARFQLFGDTVNTAARMESTGARRKIHISKETAELIIEADHSDWVKPRQDIVVAKGKGEMQTYWLLPQRVSNAAESERVSMARNDEEVKEGHEAISAAAQEEQEDGPVEDVNGDDEEAEGKVQRLVDYTSEILQQILKRIIAKRGRNRISPFAEEKLSALEDEIGKTGICLDEVEAIIELPAFDEAAYSDKGVELDVEVVSQLVSFVKMVAMMYRNNPFHNFDHASHVTQSTSKLLSRIVAVKDIDEVEKLHDHTYGITSDPLTQFAVVFSSLIHDVDHRGVPNFLLVKEEPALAAMYRKQAVAEQNSVDVAWNLLMDPNFTALRRTIYSNEHELRRFRKLVVNCLMATDIFDKELAALRKARWQDAFFGEHNNEDETISTNRKATIVIEHIVQASDVSHTMQHWHVYSKWNERLYAEMYSAYCKGRSSKDPTEGWYDGELWFFDNYVIPLAHKLKDCGVFGVSSDEYLNYALANRAEWEEKGKEIVERIHERYQQTFESQSSEKGTHRLSILGESEAIPTPNRHE